MSIDLRAEAVELLERLACSLIERETNPHQIFFSAAEVEIVRAWADRIIKENED